MNKELEAIRERPNFFFNGSEYPFTCLQMFLAGYESGFAAAKYNHSKPEELVSRDFTKFVTEKFGKQFPAGGKGWQTFIEENTSSEKEAFDLFFKLREEYEMNLQNK
ncbi:MAG TPA: hypothetical protein VK769_06475 [Verrucomicrobiae bacterium]|jgi:hypothetical protein|nr:hypothetical protein [Verrucomicrobiae bacterium]